MASKPYPSDTVEQAKDVAQGWKTFTEGFKVGDLTFATFEGEINGVVGQQEQINALEKQLADLRNQRDTSLTALWQQVKRVRNTVKGVYGDNASEYELVGGKRLSDRKAPVRKAKPAA